MHSLNRSATPLQQLVTGPVSECVVDLLEAVKIEVQDGQIVPLALVGKCRRQPFSQVHAIGEIGEPVVASHVGDPIVDPPLLGDILVRRYPPFTRYGPVLDRNHATVIEFLDRGRRLIARHDRQEVLHVGLGYLAGVDSGISALLQDLRYRHAWLQLAGQQSIHSRVPLVAHLQSLFGIEHAKPLGHVAQGRIQTHVLRFQLSEGAVENAQRQHPDG